MFACSSMFVRVRVEEGLVVFVCLRCESELRCREREVLRNAQVYASLDRRTRINRG